MPDEFSADAFIHPPRAYGDPPGTGVIRAKPEDFFVSEEAVCEPEGEGEHVWVRVRKRDANTDWVARELARCAAVSPRQVSYAGLKDRRAVTEQWFSVHLPGRPLPDWSGLPGEELEVLDSRRHRRKLRRGALRCNHFRLRIRQLKGGRDPLERRLKLIAESGFPNYFGPQRFGHDGANLLAASDLFAGGRKRLDRHKRSLLLSSARSLLFNAVLAERVRRGLWNSRLTGDLFQLDGRRALFAGDPEDSDLDARLAALEIHPTGPLWGRGGLSVTDDCRTLEEGILQPLEIWCAGLEEAGLTQDRRALRARAANLDWSFPEPDVLELNFSLSPGSYATVMLRELVKSG